MFTQTMIGRQSSPERRDGFSDSGGREYVPPVPQGGVPRLQ
jgi:hypothetical protein